MVLLGDRYGWIPEQDRMSAAAAEEGFAADLAGRSVTDLEIDYGVLSDSNQQPRSRFYFRKPLRRPRIPRLFAARYSDASDTDPGRGPGPAARNPETSASSRRCLAGFAITPSIGTPTRSESRD